MVVTVLDFLSFLYSVFYIDPWSICVHSVHILFPELFNSNKVLVLIY
jgi:hypothetical protein